MTTNWNNRTIPNTSYDRKRQGAFLLTEVFDFLLQENGGKIKLNQYGVDIVSWNKRTPI